MTRGVLLGAVLLAACVPPRVSTPEPRPPPPPRERPAVDPREGVRETLRRFLAAVEARDFEAARSLLSRQWRERSDAGRLERDFGLEPHAVERVARLRAHVDDALSLAGPAATLALGDGATAELVLEPDGWRVQHLD